jgi:hypothetical protein
MTDEELIADAERMIGELQQTQDPEQKLIVLSRAWSLLQRVIADLEQRAESGDAEPADAERIHALAAGFEQGTRNFAQVLRTNLTSEGPDGAT